MRGFIILCVVALILVGCSTDNPISSQAENPTVSTPADAAACLRAPRPLALIAKYDETVELIKPPNPP
jgi:hypothetical protein